MVYVSAGILPPCPRIRPDSVRRCVAYRPGSGCHGHPLRRLTLRQKRRFLVVQIRQKEDLAFIRYRIYIYSLAIVSVSHDIAAAFLSRHCLRNTSLPVYILALCWL